MARFDPTSTASGAELQPRAGDAEATIHVPTSASFYEDAIEGLTLMDERMLRAADFPPIYESGVGYRKEKEDTWRHADDVLCSGWGDCEDLAAWRAAELRVSGEDPDARVYVYRSGPMRFHAVVARGDGRLEDSSLILGMKVSQQRRENLPRWEGQAEMSDTQPREFAACAGCSAGGCAAKQQASAGEDILSRGAVGEAGRCLTDQPGVGSFWGGLRRAATGAARRLPHFPRAPQFLPAHSPTLGRMLSPAASIFGLPDAQDQMMLGSLDDEDEGHGMGDEYDDAGQAEDAGYNDPNADTQYADGGDQGGDQGGGPNPLEQAAAAAGRGIKSAASSAYDVVSDVFSPIKSGAQAALLPIKTVANVSKKVSKYMQMPFKAVNKVFSFLGGIDEVHPDQIGLIDDAEYKEGDEAFWQEASEYEDDHGHEDESRGVPVSQTPRFRTEEVSPGIWQGQVTLPTREPGKAFTLTTTPAPDEASAGDRMYNLALHAANTPAMMALTNPLAFAVLMTMRGTSKIPFGSAFKAIGGGVATAARAVGRGAETLAQTATSW